MGIAKLDDLLQRVAEVRAKQPEFVPVARIASIDATRLVLGDRFLWADQVLTVRWLRRIDDQFICAECANGPDRVSVDLHQREEILVLIPRPYDQPRETA
jgi:hypothetical protein